MLFNITNLKHFLTLYTQLISNCTFTLISYHNILAMHMYNEQVIEGQDSALMTCYYAPSIPWQGRVEYV